MTTNEQVIINGIIAKLDNCFNPKRMYELFNEINLQADEVCGSGKSYLQDISDCTYDDFMKQKEIYKMFLTDKVIDMYNKEKYYKACWDFCVDEEHKILNVNLMGIAYAVEKQLRKISNEKIEGREWYLTFKHLKNQYLEIK